MLNLPWDEEAMRLISEVILGSVALGSARTCDRLNFTADGANLTSASEMIERENAAGVVRLPEAWETGPKDTVISYPGEITRVKATFDREVQFVRHSHSLENEDNVLMRPYAVGPVQNPSQ